MAILLPMLLRTTSPQCCQLSARTASNHLRLAGAQNQVCAIDVTRARLSVSILECSFCLQKRYAQLASHGDHSATANYMCAILSPLNICACFGRLDLQAPGVKWAAVKRLVIEGVPKMFPIGNNCEDCYQLASDLGIPAQGMKRRLEDDARLQKQASQAKKCRTNSDARQHLNTHETCSVLSSVVCKVSEECLLLSESQVMKVLNTTRLLKAIVDNHPSVMFPKFGHAGELDKFYMFRLTGADSEQIYKKAVLEFSYSVLNAEVLVSPSSALYDGRARTAFKRRVADDLGSSSSSIENMSLSLEDFIQAHRKKPRVDATAGNEDGTINLEAESVEGGGVICGVAAAEYDSSAATPKRRLAAGAKMTGASAAMASPAHSSPRLARGASSHSLGDGASGDFDVESTLAAGACGYSDKHPTCVLLVAWAHTHSCQEHTLLVMVVCFGVRSYQHVCACVYVCNMI